MAAEKPIKKDKKDKKEKRIEAGNVSKPKKEKKDKKEKKEKLAAALEDQLQHDAAEQSKAAVVPVANGGDDSDEEGGKVEEVVLKAPVVSFAIPLADEKGTKKVYKTIRKAAKNNTLKRGVKEVVKALRKSPPSAPGNTAFPGVVIIAGDISPMDVISHIPVLCEDHNVPFMFVTSRAELGAAAKTKRPTSVVMIMEKREANKKESKDAAAGDEEDDGEAYAESYAALAKYFTKEYRKQGFWVQGDPNI